jgi:chromosome segregation ATPase
VRTAVGQTAEHEVIAAVDVLVQSLHTKREHLARRLADIERELQALTGKLNAAEPHLGDIRSHASVR